MFILLLVLVFAFCSRQMFLLPSMSLLHYSTADLTFGKLADLVIQCPPPTAVWSSPPKVRDVILDSSLASPEQSSVFVLNYSRVVLCVFRVVVLLEDPQPSTERHCTPKCPDNLLIDYFVLLGGGVQIRLSGVSFSSGVFLVVTNNQNKAFR